MPSFFQFHSVKLSKVIGGLLLTFCLAQASRAENDPSFPCDSLSERIENVAAQVIGSKFQTDKSIQDYSYDFTGTAFTKFVDNIKSLVVSQQVMSEPLVWVNLGAGDAVAELDLLEWIAQQSSGPSPLRVVSIGYSAPVNTPEDPHRRNRWLARVEAVKQKLGNDAFVYVETKGYVQPSENRLEGEDGFFYAVPSDEIPGAAIATDQRGINNFTRHFSQNLEKSLRLLNIGAHMVFTLPADPGYFEVRTVDGRPMAPIDFFKKVSGIEIHTFRKERREENGEVFHIWIIDVERTGNPVVPPTRLVSIDDTVAPPPKRTIQLLRE